MWREFVWHKQTKNQLARRGWLSKRKITKLLDEYEPADKIHRPRSIVAVIDATYFSRKNGFLVAREPHQKENLHCHEIVSETKIEYQKVRADLEQNGYTLLAVVLDGRRGIPRVFDDIPVQICQYHQWQVVRRKLTLKPKLESHQVLFSIARRIKKSNEKEMAKLLSWFAKQYRAKLSEKTFTFGTKRWRYTHAKLRSAFQSLVRNLPNLYTCQKYPGLKIPNTTNTLDGSFNSLKLHINVHRGLRRDRRLKIIRGYLGL